MLRHVGINAANPLTIITQDMARAFLSGSALSWQTFHAHATFLCLSALARLV